MGHNEIDGESPIYLQLREIIRRKIEDEEYLPGMPIPSENELAQTYGISRMTVRSGIDSLVKEGLLKPVQGKGIYVAGQKMKRDLETLGGFTQTMKEKSLKPCTKVLEKTLRKAGEKYSSILNVDPKDDIYYIKRICYADGEPISLDEVFIPKYIVPKLEGIDLEVFSIFEVYELYNINLKQAWQTLDIITLDPREAKLLEIDEDSPVMLFECSSYDEKNRTIEFSRTYTRSDKCEFSVSFSKV